MLTKCFTGAAMNVLITSRLCSKHDQSVQFMKLLHKYYFIIVQTTICKTFWYNILEPHILKREASQMQNLTLKSKRFSKVSAKPSTAVILLNKLRKSKYNACSFHEGGVKRITSISSTKASWSIATLLQFSSKGDVQCSRDPIHFMPEIRKLYLIAVAPFCGRPSFAKQWAKKALSGIEITNLTTSTLSFMHI